MIVLRMLSTMAKLTTMVHTDDGADVDDDTWDGGTVSLKFTSTLFCFPLLPPPLVEQTVASLARAKRQAFSEKGKADDSDKDEDRPVWK